MAHSTNYFDTFISVAPDCPVTTAEIPPDRETKTIARLQYELINEHPYSYTSDDVLLGVHASRNAIPEPEWANERAEFFSTGRACLRSSPLAKRYGWGFHHDGNGTVAMYAVESDEYAALSADESLDQRPAMRSSRK